MQADIIVLKAASTKISIQACATRFCWINRRRLHRNTLVTLDLDCLAILLDSESTNIKQANLHISASLTLGNLLESYPEELPLSPLASATSGILRSLITSTSSISKLRASRS